MPIPGRAVEFVKQLPKTHSGKVQRYFARPSPGAIGARDADRVRVDLQHSVAINVGVALQVVVSAVATGDQPLGACQPGACPSAVSPGSPPTHFAEPCITIWPPVRIETSGGDTDAIPE
jgi:hypothetical protein